MESEDEEVLAANYARIRNNLMNARDDMIISNYLKNMIGSKDSWRDYFVEGEDVYKEDPRETCDFMKPTFARVESRTEACGRIDKCESGCWRIMARDKLIKNEDTGKILGFKKIFKFCGKKTKPREYKRRWVMEEYRVPSKWKQDHVICKIRLLFQDEIRFLLAKHFSYTLDTPATQSLPAYGVGIGNPQNEGAYYLQKIINSGGDVWPQDVTNDVYSLHPLALVDPQDQDFLDCGLCIFANRKEASGYTDGCDSGYWRIMDPDIQINSVGMELMGYKRVFRFYGKEERDNFVYNEKNGEAVKGTWIMEEYRLANEVMKNKVFCVIKLRFGW